MQQVMQAWPYMANSTVALGAGVIGFLILIFRGCHREPRKTGKPSARKVTNSILLSIGFYTMFVLVFGSFFLKIPISEAVKESAGDPRLAWVFAGIAADFFGRLVVLFMA